MESLARSANRGSVSTGYDIDNSLKLEADNTEYLSRTPSSAGNRKTWTLSCWVKRTELTADSNSAGNQHMILSAGDTYIQFDGNAIWANFRASSVNYFLATNRLFRDTSAWYHIVLICDTTESTASNRAKLYINGVQETSLQNSTYDNMSQNYDTLMNSTNEHEVGKYSNEETTYANFFSGYIAEMHLVDGTALAPTDFGKTDDSGIWKPKQYTGSHGTNGFYLDFEDSSSLGADASANSNNFSLTNIAAADQATDTPTNNFCVLNANHRGNYFKAPTEGGTYIPMNGVNQDAAYAGTIGVTQGKWYYETYIDMRSSTYGLTVYVGYHTFQDKYRDNAYWSSTDQESFAGYLMHGGNYYSWDSGSRVLDSSLGGLGTSQVGQFFGVALNLDDNQISFYVNGSAISNASNLALNDLGDETDTGIFALPAISVYDNNHTVNFGGYTKATISSAQTDANGYGTFEHEPPSGYYALCSKNLAEFG